MKSAINDTRLLVRCSQMYYEEGLNQSYIAEKLGVSKSTISRILNNAKEQGIIKITVVNPIDYNLIELEEKFEKAFGLKEVIIVDTDSDDPTVVKEELTKAGAAYLERILKNGQIIGITWGTTVRGLSKYVTNNKKNDVTFLPLSGGLGQADIEIHPNQIVRKLAMKFKANSKVLLAPSMVDNLDRKNMFVEDKNIYEVLKLYDEVDVAITGIGSPTLNTSTMLSSGYYTKEELDELVKQGAVADVGNMLIDANGDGSKFESNDRVIGMSLDQFKKTPLTIGIAGTTQKVDAMKAVLKGHYLDVLITDYKTAVTILDEI